ncbi:hypothetical protein Tdes44962_MAKER06654 [Teratosphaeria destructans]|uniref:2EXR domain-containing protein n=1 Tax=Teratosphaeria destructans TaxID=418781 RepID=A0A9W7T0W8_9PEZI|nr:hypothetical protein Tdes44962_MAKER06654 [Teratosphaeria destructans]
MAASTTTTTLPAKRKRLPISYAAADEALDSMLGVEAFEADYESDGDVDMTYGSRAKPKTKSKPAKRRKTSRNAKKEKPFPFMLLPAELRDVIYELALTDPSGVALASTTKDYRRTVTRIPSSSASGYRYRGRRWRHGRHDSQQSQRSQTRGAKPNQLVPSLLAVSKAVHAEAVGWLYQQPIIVSDNYALHSFLASIGSHRTQVTDIVVRGWGEGRGAHKAMNYCAFAMLSTCTNLKSLFLDCEIGYVRRPYRLARQIFRDANVWLDAYGARHGSKDAAVDMLELRECNFDRNEAPVWNHRDLQLPEKDNFKKEFKAELRRLLG